MFDEVLINCPQCGKCNYEQSKGGDCNLDVYTLGDAPIEILEDLAREPMYCSNCSFKYELVLSPPTRPTYSIVPFKINRHRDD